MSLVHIFNDKIMAPNTPSFVFSAPLRTKRHVPRYCQHPQRRPHVSTPPQRATPIATAQPLESKPASESESELLSALNSLPSHVTEDGMIADQVRALENAGGFSRIPPRKLYVAAWRLAATDATAVRRNGGGVTGIPGFRCARLSVELARTGRARTVEHMSAIWGLLNAVNVLEGSWKVDDRGVLNVTYASLVLLGGLFNLRADSKAVLQTTYCSPALRIGRSGKGEFYVFVNEGEVEEENDT